MPLALSSFLVPASTSIPFLMEDIYLRGGFRVLADTAARDGLHPATKKPGMLVHTQSDGVTWQLQNDGTWLEFGGVGGGGGDYLLKTGDTLTGHLVARTPPIDDTDPFVDDELIPQSEVKALVNVVGTAVTDLDVRVTGLENADYVHTQATADTQWSITHNLTSSAFIIQVYDDTGNTVHPSNITFVDEDNVVLDFAIAKKGQAIIFAP